MDTEQEELNNTRYDIIYAIYANVSCIKEWKNKYKTLLFKIELNRLKQIHEQHLKLRLLNLKSK